MRIFKFISSLSLLSVVACAAKLDTDKKKMSYVIGQQIGGSFKSQNIEVDMDVLADSIQDALDGKKAKLTPEESRNVMMTAQKGMEAKQKEKAEANKKTGDSYLDENKKKEGVVTSKTGLQYKILKAGTGATPKEADTVSAHYKGTLIDGTEFDSSYKRGAPTEFPVMGVIPGWTEALLTMKVGEKRELVIPSDLAYGPSGRPGIPPNSVLVFEMELMDIVKGNPPPAAAKKAAKPPVKKKL